MRDLGLDNQEVIQRRLLYGWNQIENRSGVVWWRVFLIQFKSPLIIILLFAGIVSFLTGELVDGGVIGFMVLINTLLGFIQEYKAEKTMESLAELVMVQAKVKRTGEWLEIPARELVPGDIVRLEIGRTVPADGKLLVSEGIFFNEAVITGEGMPIEKKIGDTCLMGMVVERGIGEMEVVAIGKKTKMGQLAKEAGETVKKETLLQKKVRRLSYQLGLLVLVVVLVVLTEGWISGRSWGEVIPVAVALAVSTIPEALAISLVLILVVGMRRIFKRKALVRKLLAAETLGSIDVLCLDKTGTITEGKMTAVGGVINPEHDFYSEVKGKEGKDGNRENFEFLVKGAILCNDMRDPLEVAMNIWGRQQLDKNDNNGYGEKIEDIYRRVGELPFDPKYKYIVTRHQTEKEGEMIEFLSGAPEVMLEHSTIGDKLKEEWKKKFQSLGGQGYRLVGFAYKKIARGGDKILREEVEGYSFLGVVVYEDPLRIGVVEMINKMRQFGVRLKMITGDYKETAWAIARQAGIVDGEINERELLTGTELDVLSGNELLTKMNEVKVFARTTPEQKLIIVKKLQEAGLVVAMTGDGVNDALALKQANIGVVVGDASDVARETADIVLLDNNLGTMLAAIEEGRVITVNLRKVMMYLLVSAFGGVVVVLGAMFLGFGLPLSPIQILWLNLVGEGLPYMALTMEPKRSDLLEHKMKKRGDLLSIKEMIYVVLVAVIIGLLSILIFVLEINRGGSLLEARTMAFLVLGLTNLFNVFSIRDLNKSVWKSEVFNNRWLILGVLGGVVMLLSAVYLPMSEVVFKTVKVARADWFLIGGGILGALLLVEIAKYLVFEVDKERYRG